MIVLDASAALSGLLNAGPGRQALSEQRLHVPHLIDAEIASGLRRRVAARDLSAGEGWKLLDSWRHLGVRRYPGVWLLARVWELRENFSTYDASYVALAEHLDCALLTADRRLSRAPGSRCSITVVPR